MRILILGSSTINKGAEAMLRTVQTELGSRLPDARFFVGDRRARQWQHERVVAAGVPLAPVQMKPRGQRQLRLGLHALQSSESVRHWIQKRDRHYYLDALASQVDAAVDVSGFLFSDQRGTRGASHLADIAEVFRSRGKPIVLLPQAWGPFEDPGVSRHTKRACDNANIVYARDTISYNHLQHLLGPSFDRVRQAPDIAFLFAPASNRDALLKEVGLDLSRPIAAIVPNMRVYERTVGDGGESVYVQTLTRVGQELRERGAQILLLPHELIPENDQRDDRYICKLIANKLGHEDVSVVVRDCTAEDMKAMISGCDLLLGSRFHALIASLSSSVPSVAIGWAHKYPELFREFGLEHLVLDHDALSEDVLAEMVQSVWETRTEVKHRIDQSLPDVKARSFAVFDTVSTLLSGTYRDG